MGIRRLALLGILALAVILLVLNLNEPKQPPVVETEITITHTLLYTSTVKLNDGRVFVSYATGIFDDDGNLLKVVGNPTLEAGLTYRFTIVPDAFGESWDRLVSLEQLTFFNPTHIPARETCT